MSENIFDYKRDNQLISELTDLNIEQVIEIRKK